MKFEITEDQDFPQPEADGDTLVVYVRGSSGEYVEEYTAVDGQWQLTLSTVPWQMRV